MFIRFDVIHERDRQTDGQTLHDSIDRACIASHGNNECSVIVRTIAVIICSDASHPDHAITYFASFTVCSEAY